MQLPIFPVGVTEINSRVAVEAKEGQVCYVYGHLPVFQHEEADVRSFRMFTSQMIVTGSVKPLCKLTMEQSRRIAHSRPRWTTLV